MEIKRIVRVFLSASLNELTEERDELGGFFTSLNNVFVERGLYFELLTGEDLVLATVQEDIIRNCEFFYVLFYRTAEKEVVEQFNTALARKTECGKPRIVTMFRELASDEKASDAVAAFMHRLDAELGHYYNYFSNIDSVKLSMLLEIARDETLGISLEFRDAKILVDGRKLAGEGSSPEIHLASVPFYAKNIRCV